MPKQRNTDQRKRILRIVNTNNVYDNNLDLTDCYMYCYRTLLIFPYLDQFLYYHSYRRMGCEESRLAHKHTNQITLFIIDSELRQETQTLLLTQNIATKLFVNVHCLIQALENSYAHHIVVRENNYQALRSELQKANLNPHILVITKTHNESKKEEKVTFFTDYQDLQVLLQKHQQTSKKHKKKQKQVRVDVKILKDFKGQTESQLFIFEETLKIKNISYQLFNTFSQLQDSRTRSEIIIIDYRFHRAAITLGLKSRVICYCDFKAEEEYDPHVFFVTNNFQEIVNEIVIQKKLTQPVLPISKVFLYSNKRNVAHYASVFEHFNLKVKTYTNIGTLIRATRLYFSVMIICRQEQSSEVDKKIKQQGCEFRMRVITINDQTECSARGLRKVIKEVKRGYLVEKTVSKVVDIIDKYHSDSKFEEIKKELTKNKIRYRCYSNAGEYSKKFNYIAPLIICNLEQRIQLSKFLEHAKIKAKILIFCNRGKINEQLTNDSRWSYVSSHFSKIIKYIKNNKVLFPLILDENQQKLQVKQQNLKNRQNRVSLLKMTTPSKTQKDFIQSFILTNKGSPQEILKNIQEEASNLLKLTYKPFQDIDQFRNNLTASLSQLRKRQIIEEKDLHNIDLQLNLHGLMLKYRYLLKDQRQMKTGLNKMLTMIQKAKQGELRQIKEVLFLLFMNYIGFYEIRKIQSINLSCWVNESSFDLCQVGNALICKNFLFMKQEGTQQRVAQSVKLQIDIQCSTLINNVLLSPYFNIQGKYVFAPYTQFQIVKIDCQNQVKVIHLKLKEQNYFLKRYFEENLENNWQSFLTREVAKSTSVLVDISKRQKVEMNSKRIKALQLWKEGVPKNTQQAIKIGYELIRKEQLSDNFDSKLLTELKFQLVNFLANQEKSQQVFSLISQIKQGSPNAYIKYNCGCLLLKLKGILQKNGRDSSKIKSSKCLQLKQEIEKESQESQSEIENGQQNILYQNLFHCLQVDQRQNQQFN